MFAMFSDYFMGNKHAAHCPFINLLILSLKCFRVFYYAPASLTGILYRKVLRSKSENNVPPLWWR